MVCYGQFSFLSEFIKHFIRAKNPRLGWITLKELERILLEREKTLEEKEKELHARENEVEEHTISADLVKGIPV